MRLDDFVKNFELMEVTKYDFNPVQRERTEDAKDIAHHFGSVLQDIYDNLVQNDNSKLRAMFNTDSFNQFRKAAKNAVAATKSNDPDKMKAAMEKLFAAGNIYEDHCETKQLDENSNIRDLERQKTAKITALLHEEFEAYFQNGKNRDDVVYQELAEKTGMLTSGYDAMQKLTEQTAAKAENPQEVQRLSALMLDEKKYQSINLNKIGGMSRKDKLKFFRDPANYDIVSAMVLLVEHPEKVREAMPDADESQIQSLSRNLRTVVESLRVSLDPKRYRTEQLTSPAKIDSFKNLSINLRIAQNALKNMEKQPVAAANHANDPAQNANNANRDAHGNDNQVRNNQGPALH